MLHFRTFRQTVDNEIPLDLQVSKTTVTVTPLFHASATSQSKIRPRLGAPWKYGQTTVAWTTNLGKQGRPDNTPNILEIRHLAVKYQQHLCAVLYVVQPFAVGIYSVWRMPVLLSPISIYNLIHRYKVILASPCMQKGRRIAQLIEIL